MKPINSWAKEEDALRRLYVEDEWLGLIVHKTTFSHLKEFLCAGFGASTANNSHV